jgi:hypothetical protein
MSDVKGIVFVLILSTQASVYGGSSQFNETQNQNHQNEKQVSVIPCQIQPRIDANKWAIAVQSWISEFQNRRSKSLPPFDSIFK